MRNYVILLILNTTLLGMYIRIKKNLKIASNTLLYKFKTPYRNVSPTVYLKNHVFQIRFYRINSNKLYIFFTYYSYI